jgi:hypothetical protein
MLRTLSSYSRAGVSSGRFAFRPNGLRRLNAPPILAIGFFCVVSVLVLALAVAASVF